MSLIAFYRYRSGHPYTPGFRDGVDINGDGSAVNDPAFVDDQISGMDAVIAASECLRSQVGRFVERNSCREPGVDRLDLRVELGPVRVATYPVRVLVDVLNVLDAEAPVTDRALYLVDPAGSVTLDPATGTVAVPLVANPDFGTPRALRGSGRAIRLGVRVNY